MCLNPMPDPNPHMLVVCLAIYWSLSYIPQEPTMHRRYQGMTGYLYPLFDLGRYPTFQNTRNNQRKTGISTILGHFLFQMYIRRGSYRVPLLAFLPLLHFPVPYSSLPYTLKQPLPLLFPGNIFRLARIVRSRLILSTIYGE